MKQKSSLNYDIANLCLGTQIKKVRVLKEMTLTDLARAAETSLPYLSSIESNDKVPEHRVLSKICKVLEIMPHELFVKAYLEDINEVTESCWDNKYPQIRTLVDLMGNKIYPKADKKWTAAEEKLVLAARY